MNAEQDTRDTKEACFAKPHSAVALLSCRLDDVLYDAEAAQQLEAVVAEEKVHVQRCKETVDDLASHLAGMIAHLLSINIHVSLFLFCETANKAGSCAG